MINLVIDPNIIWLERGKKVADFLINMYPSDYSISSKMEKNVYNIVLTQKPIDSYVGCLRENMEGIHFVRPKHPTLSANRATNGFSVYKSYSDSYRYFIPLLSELYKKNTVSENCIGFYYQPYKKSRDLYLDYINFLNDPYNVLYMGPKIPEELLSKKHRWENVVDKEIFFNRVSHFIYAKSKEFLDPWPTSLEEAVFNDKQIIIIETSRNFKDGIDDIQDCIKYHTHLDSDIFKTMISNENSILLKFNHLLYYKMLLLIDWDVRKIYDVDRFNSIVDILEIFATV